MHTVRKLLQYLLAPTLATGTSLAQAGSVGSVMFSFTPAAPSSAALAVPLLGDVALLILGLLLIVVALRALQASKGIQKLFSAVLLGAGMIVGGIGAERASALALVVFVIGEETGNLDCAGVTDQPYPLYHGGAATVTNHCEVPGEVTTEYSASGVSCSLEGGTCNTLEAGDTCILPEEVCSPPVPPS